MADSEGSKSKNRVGAALERARRPDGAQMDKLKGRTPLWFTFVFLFAIATYQIMMNPFGFSDLTQRYTQDISNLLITGPYLYGREGHEQITVALVEDSALQALDMPWPWTYGMQARALDTILAYKPRAVVVDVTFVDARKDATLPELVEEIRRYQQAGVPLYFTGSTESQTGVRKELADAGVKVVSPEMLLNQGIARQYPVQAHCFGKPRESGCDSMAVAVYRDLYPGKLSPDINGEIELVWGTKTDPVNDRWMHDVDENGKAQSCYKDMSFARRIWLAFFDPSAVRSSCPYASTVPVEALLQGAEDRDIDKLIPGKIVFYGASLQSVEDRAFTPVNGLMPGVYVHAMALDNLITFHGRPEQNVVTVGGTTLDSNPVQVLAIIPVIFILAWIHRRRLRRLSANADRSAAMEYIFEKMTEWFWHFLAYALALGMGLLLAVAVGLSVANWVEVVFVSVELAALLLLRVPDTIWGYICHVIGVIAELDDDPAELPGGKKT